MRTAGLFAVSLIELLSSIVTTVVVVIVVGEVAGWWNLL